MIELEDHQVAFDLLKTENYTQKQVAKILGVTENTISNWSKKHNFKDRLSEVKSVTEHRVRILTNCYERASTISNTPKFDADELSKVVRVIELMEAKTSLTHFQKVGQRFLLYLYAHEDEGTAELFKSKYTGFIQHTTKKISE